MGGFEEFFFFFIFQKKKKERKRVGLFLKSCLGYLFKCVFFFCFLTIFK